MTVQMLGRNILQGIVGTTLLIFCRYVKNCRINPEKKGALSHGLLI